MDLNSTIIHEVHKHPALYKNKTTLQQRDCIWQEIANKLQVKDQLLKCRWHALLNNLKKSIENNSTFLYRAEMEFVIPQMTADIREERRKKVSAEHEFIITAKDLENNLNDEEEITFEEIQTIEEHELSRNNAEAAKEKITTSSQLLAEKSEAVRPASKEITDQQDMADNKQHNISVCREELLPEPSQSCESKANVAVASKSASESTLKETKECSEKIAISSADNTADTNRKEERCEDAIFGELVTAMLKGMDAERKRRVKRDIMNSLLS